MSFQAISRYMITCKAARAMATEQKTEIETKVSGSWVHDANDSNKAMASYN